MAHTSDIPASAGNPLPPDERFWKRYSPHHEALLSGVGSLTLHGLVVGIMVLVAWAALWSRSSEAQRPPNMDVVRLVGTNGDGQDGGGAPAPLGSPDGGNQEAVEPKMNDVMVPATRAETDLTEIPTPSVNSAVGEEAKPLEDLSADLAKISEAASKLQKPAAPPKMVRTNTRPKGLATGQAGGRDFGGSGGGSGTGKGTGTGAGSGGAPGRPMTKQEIFAQRWRFELSGNGKEHADKLAAAGVIVVIHHRVGQAFVIKDLRHRPVMATAGYPAEFKDAVRWYNRSAESVMHFGHELKVNPADIAGVELLLPKDREEKMAAAEAAYARQKGRPLARITETTFDFRLVNGGFEPIVIGQR